jgi:hypothetical protein
MKKLLTLLLFIGLVAPSAFAELEFIYDDGISATISTATAVACTLSYVIVESTGIAVASTVRNQTITIRSGNVTKLTLYANGASTGNSQVYFLDPPLNCPKGVNYAVNGVNNSGISMSFVIERAGLK